MVKAAEEREIKLRQNYNRVSKAAIFWHGRYSASRKKGKANKETGKLRKYLGRVIRDIRRKYPNPDDELRELLEISERIYEQKRHDSGKIYSIHEPTVSCISKGKAHKKYEFGSKVSIVATSKGGWILGAETFRGNPHDSKTLSSAMCQIEKMGFSPKYAFVDKGYRGHNYVGKTEIYVDKYKRGSIKRSLWKWMKRRAAIEPTIVHLKREHGMGRNMLKGELGDQMNALLSASGMNIAKLLSYIRVCALYLYFFVIFRREIIKKSALQTL